MFDLASLQPNTMLRINTRTFRYYISLTPSKMIGAQTLLGIVIMNTDDPQLYQLLQTKQAPPPDTGISRLVEKNATLTLYLGDYAFTGEEPIQKIVRFTGNGEEELV